MNRREPTDLSEPLMLSMLGQGNKVHKNHVTHRTVSCYKRSVWKRRDDGGLAMGVVHPTPTNIRKISYRRTNTFNVASEDMSRTSERV